MSADSPQTTSHETERVSTPQTSLNSPSVGELPPVTPRYSSTDRAWLYRADRAILRARTAALEREIERRERRLNRVIEQYERLLTERAAARAELDNGTVEVEDPDRGVFGRLRSVLGR